MMEMRVKELMDAVEKRIRHTPGLERIETLVDRSDPNRYVVVTEWTNRVYLNKWLQSDLCKQTVQELNGVLDQKKVKYREFLRHEDDVFLL